MKVKMNLDNIQKEKPNVEGQYFYRRKNWKNWIKCKVYKKNSIIYEERNGFRYIEWWVLFIDSCTPIKMRYVPNNCEWLKIN